jgi:hypothetical protein
MGLQKHSCREGVSAFTGTRNPDVLQTLRVTSNGPLPAFVCDGVIVIDEKRSELMQTRTTTEARFIALNIPKAFSAVNIKVGLTAMPRREQNNQ